MDRILILMTEAGGGGHYASAEALREAFRETASDTCTVEMVDLWSHYTPPPLSSVPHSYRMLVDDLPWLYRILYEAGERSEIIEPLMTVAAQVFRFPVVRALKKYSPYVVVSVHPLIQQVVLRVLKSARSDVPFVTVVTDLVTIPPVWFSKAVDLCIVPSEEAFAQGLRAGLSQAQLRLCGLPIRAGFGRLQLPRAELRSKLELADRPTALLVGGGEGMGQMSPVARTVAAELARDSQRADWPMGQLVVICGRNESLEEELKSYPWPVPTVVKGYVSDIWTWMAASDLVVTKAGPGTIAEACALGLPVVLTGYIRGQESGNVPFVLRHGCGVYAEDPTHIAKVVSGWFGPQQAIMKQMAANAASLGRPRAAMDIAGEILRVLRESRVARAALAENS